MVSPQATEPRHLDVPGRRLHPLKGDLAGYWSITVSARPGLSVRYDCIEPLGLTITEAADVLDVTRQTPTIWSTARAVFGPTLQSGSTRRSAVPRKHGSRLQMAYELAEARQHEGEIKVKPVRRR